MSISATIATTIYVGGFGVVAATAFGLAFRAVRMRMRSIAFALSVIGAVVLAGIGALLLPPMPQDVRDIRTGPTVTLTE